MRVQVREKDTNVVIVKVTTCDKDILYNFWVEGFRRKCIDATIEVFLDNSTDEPDETYEPYE